MRRLVGVLAALACAAGCSSGAQVFAVTDASVDPTYLCPGGANNAPYDVHAKVTVHNGTGKTVTISGVTAVMTLVAVRGDWLEKVGDRFDAGDAKFTPSSVATGADATLAVTITSACTSGQHGSGASSSGDYSVTIHLATSAGSYSISAHNRHEIVAA